MAELRARLRVHYANCRLGCVPEYCVTGRDLGDVSGGSGQPKLVYWSGSTRPGRPHEMYWELPHRDIGPVIEQLEGAEEITGLVSETLGSHAGQTICAMSHEQPAAIGQIASVLPAAGNPPRLHPISTTRSGMRPRCCSRR